jgi:hypothetical protein
VIAYGIDTQVERFPRITGGAINLAPVAFGEEGIMTLSNLLGRTGRTLAVTAAIVGAIGLAAAPKPAHALSPGEGVAIGLGALAVGSALGAASNPYYYGNPGYYGYYGAPAYYGNGYGYGYGYGPRSCWSPYYGRYYAC